MIHEQDPTDSQFERVEQLVKQQPQPSIPTEDTTSKLYLQLQYSYDEDEPMKRDSLLQANPILPPGKHQIQQQPQFRLKFMSLRDKFNKTSFALSSTHPRKHKPTPSQPTQDNPSPSNYPEDLDPCSDDYPELQALLKDRCQVYRRINNSKLNILGKDRVLFSLFFDLRKQRITARREPVFEHLSKIRKTKNPKPAYSSWLSFNSSMESGNLLMALHEPASALATYELYMQNDVNTKGCTQWFYFSVSNSARGKAKLRLMNFYKPTSLYQRGMKVLCSNDGLEWRRTGTAITYGPASEERGGYALDFIHDFDVIGRTTYFAYGYPYNYSDHLGGFIDSLLSDQRLFKTINRTNLCLSAMGNPVPMLTISSPVTGGRREPKPIIYVIGRQHPGQTPASLIVQGLISFLVGPSQQAKQLREKYEFKIVPMVNVDGVISGNYRSNLSGSDVNRQWQFPSKRAHPEIYWLKQQVANNRRQVAFFLDIHAHSRKMNSFFYGSKAAERDSKMYPFVCSKLNKFISYTQSSFSDDPSKRTTARVVLENQFQIPHSLTFQVSFYGWEDTAKGTNYSFKQSDLRGIGEGLGIGFYYSFIGMERAKKSEEPKTSLLPKCQSEKEKTLYKNSVKMLDKWTKQLQKQRSQQQMDEVYSQGSSLDPEHFQLKQQQRQFLSLQHQRGQQQSLKRNLSSPKQDPPHPQRNRLLIYSTLSPGQINDSKLLAPKGDNSNGQNLGISSNEFGHFSLSSTKDQKKLFSVRELQLQLSEHEPSKKMRGIRLKMGNVNLTGMDRYDSIDKSKTDRVKNYKQDVLEMKKALKYLLQTKSTDYEQYRSCFKSYNNESLQSTLYRSSRRDSKL